jgi:hypothetical protein
VSSPPPLNEQESLRLITEMIQKAKQSQFHDSGTSAILWGSVVGAVGILNFLDRYFRWQTRFDWWLLVLLALVPQVFIAVRQGRRKPVQSHADLAVDTVWLVYGISIFALVTYFNVVPAQSDRLLALQQIELFQKNTGSNQFSPFSIFVPSAMSLLMIVYAFPTLVTGIVKQFKPMLWGALVCYGFFLASLFTNSTLDLLFNGLAGIGNWLIPGLILRKKYLQSRQHVS